MVAAEIPFLEVLNKRLYIHLALNPRGMLYTDIEWAKIAYTQNTLACPSYCHTGFANRDRKTVDNPLPSITKTTSVAHSLVTEAAREVAPEGPTCTRSSSFLSSRRCTWHRRPSVIYGRRQTIGTENLAVGWSFQRSVGWTPPGSIPWVRLPSLGVGHIMPRSGWTIGQSRKYLWSPFWVPTGMMEFIRQRHTRRYMCLQVFTARGADVKWISKHTSNNLLDGGVVQPVVTLPSWSPPTKVKAQNAISASFSSSLLMTSKNEV